MRVSIRLADAWPFQPVQAFVLRVPQRGFQSALRMRGLFNPWCANLCASTGTEVSIRLADAWPFQLGGSSSRSHVRSMFQSALRMRGLFNRANCDSAPAPPECFNPPCGCVAFSTGEASRVGMRLRGFNPPCGCVAFSTRYDRRATTDARVSIRLADAWPFQLPDSNPLVGSLDSFNPPCGCVAFSTRAGTS